MSKTKNYMSIGDVLKSLLEEFPDVSISKIRFLESEGLIEPERTPSGYRKFHDEDVSRLRYILRLQRDQFVPLKVIRKRLEHFDPAEASVELPAAAAPKPSAEPTVQVMEEDDLPVLEGGLSLSRDDFARTIGVDDDGIDELEEFGLVDSHQLDDGSLYYDEDDVLIAKIAKDFGKFGIQPRHLKMYKNFAEKEADLFRQVVVPVSRNASGEGKRQARVSVLELTKLSKRLKQALLRSSLREYLQG